MGHLVGVNSYEIAGNAILCGNICLVLTEIRLLVGLNKLSCCGDALCQKSYINATFHIGADGTLLKPCRPTTSMTITPPLVDRDTYDMAQEIRELRKRKGQPIQYPYGKLITCPVCGRPLQRICLDRVGSPAVWHCPPTDENGKPLGITDCCGAYVHETDIDAALRKAYSELDFEDIRPEVWYVLPPSPVVVK